MNEKRMSRITLSAVALGIGLLGGTYAASAAQMQPAYDSSIKVGNQNEGESGEAALLASQAKIDSSQATAAALGQVPGKVLGVSLDNENGNLVYSVEVKTGDNQIKDVKVDAGNASVLSVNTGGEDNGIEQDYANEGDHEAN